MPRGHAANSKVKVDQVNFVFWEFSSDNKNICVNKKKPKVRDENLQV